jgi:hypothetical protein
MSVAVMRPSVLTKPMTMSMLLRALDTCTPWRWTSWGNSGSASCSLFCTCT